jgi:nucleolar pre-ribosomal-associated protein 1
VSGLTVSGIRRFKDFLTSISTCENTAEQASKLKVLKEYCDNQSSVEKYAPDFPDLLSAWSFAVEHKTDSILSAVPAVLAQFLKTISSYLEFRDFGISLCRTLLLRDQLHLFERGLSAPTAKEHVISPCLRLLTEMVSFDGGAVAQDVFSKRDPLFKRLDVFLSEIPRHKIEEVGNWSRPTLRRIAQRLVLANLKFQNADARAELILQGKVLHSTLRGMEDDGADIVHDILQAIDKQIVSNDSIPRNLKSRFLNSGNLASLLRLYGYDDSPSSMDSHTSVRDSAHNFLLSVCTQSEKGLLVAQSGWYPAGMNPEAQYPGSSRSGLIDLGLNSLAHFDNYSENVPIKNATLSTFVKSLRPEKDTLQANLLVEAFRAAPELIADYFSKKTKFVCPPKDEPEWRGHFAFLFLVIQLPVPAFCGWYEKLPEIPPPLSIVIESILPRPFDRSMLTRCLNLNQEIFTMSAIRAITVALHKLQDTIKLFQTAVLDKNLWSQASYKLIEMFMQRTPPVKDIATALQRVPKDNPRLRGTMAQCLALYLKIVPQSANVVKFDITKALVDILQTLNGEGLDEDTHDILIDQLPDYLAIAAKLPSTRWWQLSGKSI